MHCSYQAKKTLKVWDLLQQVLYVGPVHVSASFNALLWPCGRFHIRVWPLCLCKIRSQKPARWNQRKNQVVHMSKSHRVLNPTRFSKLQNLSHDLHTTWNASDEMAAITLSLWAARPSWQSWLQRQETNGPFRILHCFHRTKRKWSQTRFYFNLTYLIETTNFYLLKELIRIWFWWWY